MLSISLPPAFSSTVVRKVSPNLMRRELKGTSQREEEVGGWENTEVGHQMSQRGPFRNGLNRLC